MGAVFPLSSDSVPQATTDLAGLTRAGVDQTPARISHNPKSVTPDPSRVESVSGFSTIEYAERSAGLVAPALRCSAPLFRTAPSLESAALPAHLQAISEIML